MARVSNDNFQLSGQVGGLVFVKTTHGNFVRSKPTYVGKKRKSSELQLLQQEKLQVVMQFLKPMKEMIKENFFPSANQKGANSWVKSYYMKEALEKGDEDFYVNYPKALMSFGNLRIPELISVHIDDAYQITLQWADNSDQGLAFADDELLVVLYAPQAHTMLYRSGVAYRSDQSVTIDLNPNWSGLITHIWVGFSRQEKKRKTGIT